MNSPERGGQGIMRSCIYPEFFKFFLQLSVLDNNGFGNFRISFQYVLRVGNTIFVVVRHDQKCSSVCTKEINFCRLK